MSKRMVPSSLIFYISSLPNGCPSLHYQRYDIQNPKASKSEIIFEKSDKRRDFVPTAVLRDHTFKISDDLNILDIRSARTCAARPYGSEKK